MSAGVSVTPSAAAFSSRYLRRRVPAMGTMLLSRASSQAVNLIVTHVPGIMQPRYVAGARITAAYPFAPLAPHCPVSIALYGYEQRLYVGIDADRTALPDLHAFEEMLRAAFAEVIAAAARGA